MAKRTKFQADLLLRSRPPSAFDVLREAATRLQHTQSFPPGVIAAVGDTLSQVLTEVDGVNAQKAEDRRQEGLALIGEKSPA